MKKIISLIIPLVLVVAMSFATIAAPSPVAPTIPASTAKPQVITTTNTKVNIPTITKVKPKIMVSAKGNGKITIKLKKKITKANGYQIKYSANKKFKKSKVRTYSAKKKSFVLEKTKSNKKYYVKIRAYRVIDGQKVYSKWSSVKIVKIK